MNTYQRFQSKPVELEAVRRQPDDSNWAEIAELLDIDIDRMARPPLVLNVPTARGMKPLRRGDWLLRTADGTLGALDDESFRGAYEPAEGTVLELDDDAELLLK